MLLLIKKILFYTTGIHYAKQVIQFIMPGIKFHIKELCYI